MGRELDWVKGGGVLGGGGGGGGDLRGARVRRGT